ARQYGVAFDEHDQRYARTGEWLSVVNGMWSEPRFSFAGRFYQVEGAVLEPKPASRPRPTLYAGGESEAAKELIARSCDAYLMHGDPPERIAGRVARGLRERSIRRLMCWERKCAGWRKAPPGPAQENARLGPRASEGQAERHGDDLDLVGVDHALLGVDVVDAALDVAVDHAE